MAKTGLAFGVDLGSGGGDEARAQTMGKNVARLPIRRLSRLFCWIAACLTCAALITAPQVASAQCAANPGNGGIQQNGGAPCTVNNNVTVGFGTAVTATNFANVTTNGAVTAHGFGTGISAATNSIGLHPISETR
jgi:spore coat protein U-like protein